MDNIKDFQSFLNENIERREPYSATEWIKQKRRSIEAETGAEKIYQMTYDEGGALQRLVKGAVEGLRSLGQGIADLFDSGKAASMDIEGLSKNKDQVLSRWGDSIRASGKNKRGEYETFYRDAIRKGKSTFGKDFDINNPQGRDQQLYRDYVFSATDYFDLGR